MYLHSKRRRKSCIWWSEIALVPFNVGISFSVQIVANKLRFFSTEAASKKKVLFSNAVLDQIPSVPNTIF